MRLALNGLGLMMFLSSGGIDGFLSFIVIKFPIFCITAFSYCLFLMVDCISAMVGGEGRGT